MCCHGRGGGGEHFPLPGQWRQSATRCRSSGGRALPVVGATVRSAAHGLVLAGSTTCCWGDREGLCECCQGHVQTVLCAGLNKAHVVSDMHTAIVIPSQRSLSNYYWERTVGVGAGQAAPLVYATHSPGLSGVLLSILSVTGTFPTLFKLMCRIHTSFSACP